MAEETKKSISFHRSMMHLHKGGLHKALGIKPGDPIPEERLNAAMKSENNHVRAMAVLANNMKHWHH